jgi:hypothetical protein
MAVSARSAAALAPDVAAATAATEPSAPPGGNELETGWVRGGAIPAGAAASTRSRFPRVATIWRRAADTCDRMGCRGPTAGAEAGGTATPAAGADLRGIVRRTMVRADLGWATGEVFARCRPGHGSGRSLGRGDGIPAGAAVGRPAATELAATPGRAVTVRRAATVRRPAAAGRAAARGRAGRKARCATARFALRRTIGAASGDAPPVDFEASA